MMFTDALGVAHAPVDTTPRIASLVPSITELLFSLGLGDQLVARTGFCIHPREAVRNVPKVGGTKTVKLDRLRELAPTHVIVNIDENTRPTVDKLREFIPNIIVTHPCAPEDNLALYQLLGGIFRREAQAQKLSDALVQELDALRGRHFLPRRVLYAIWQDPWMTVSRDTYISRMLKLVNLHTWPEDVAPVQCGIEKSGDCARPNRPDTRYPTFRWSSDVVRSVDCVLLSSEPYSFTEEHVDALEKQIGKPVYLVDGEMVSWYGSKAIEGARYLGEFAKALR
ncbi:Vitamin B12-binding protein [Ralstonia mannitolilytica]|uniref:helical backbone metal receptor n=1 Tax=Ralstonia mannitolilytica TaxID=105219 RepID=UPI0007AFEC58|nr:helical backbone metal receptor [Ralstonia mannitolilytica]ANA33741.1 metal ABC transporter substrate-binding protein [Ralstonia mannitolilytica]CAJ0691926.1 Vitamin B12-binding protein [Ralstonia mannitolilytica]CAJ0854313.1 Vitamin B12-binding protein [Ralstonia mannitolilytica]